VIWYKSRAFMIAAGVALPAGAGLLLWLFVISDDDADRDVSVGLEDPVEASESDLVGLSEQVDHPIYWIGEQAGSTLEVTRLTKGEIFVRYLDDDAEVGDPRPGFLSVGAYPLKDAYGVLGQVAENEGVKAESSHGALVVQDEEAPQSVYLAYPDQDLQIEVYDPDPERALDVATSEELRPVD
jgi:hypothetical protein